MTVMIDALVWSARTLATLNIGIALLMLWGASAGTTGRETIAQWLRLLLIVGSVAAVVTSFRFAGDLSTPALLLMGALPALALMTLPLSPQGSTPVRDALSITTAFAAPPLLLAVAARAG